MKEYQKIETLYKFDTQRKSYIEGDFYNPIVRYLVNNKWIVSEKIDGMNIRVYWDGHKVSFSGRTDKSELPKEVARLLEETFKDAEVIFEQHFGEKEVILFMECYGGKIQGGLYGGSERLIGFDVMVNGHYLNKLTIQSIFILFGVQTAFFFELNSLYTIIHYVTHISVNDVSSDYNEYDSNTPIEGYVCVPREEIYDKKGNRIIVKIKAKDFKKLCKAEAVVDKMTSEAIINKPSSKEDKNENQN